MNFRETGTPFNLGVVWAVHATVTQKRTVQNADNSKRDYLF
jgi:hypothetical protein